MPPDTAAQIVDDELLLDGRGTAELERRCVRILAELWSAPTTRGALGCSTMGERQRAYRPAGRTS